ncbi:MAG: hypothetical protein HYX32_01085 [Actinobacteria bacterium]|nr:hypothetical protein [Actinomycetota bacterium]
MKNTSRPHAQNGSATLAFVLFLVLLAGACASKGGDNQAAPSDTTPAANAVGAVRSGPADGAVKQGGKVTYGIDGEPEGLDPTRYAFSQAGHAVASAVFDSLATIDEDGNAVPYLASAFEPNADFTSWTVVLPSGVMFHDNTPLDADALMTVWDAYRASAITGPPLKAVVASYSKQDPTRVEVKLNQPMRSFPIMFATQIGYVPAPAMLSDTTLAKKPVGSGPFIFEAQQDSKFWTFKKNPNYRQKNLPYLDAIEFQPIPDNDERNRKLQSGDLDVLQTLGGPQILELRTRPDLKKVENQRGDKAHLLMNTTKAPFDNLTARQAVAYATDAARYRKETFADVAAPANSPYGPGQPGYLADNGFPTYDLAKAKELVQKFTTETGKPLEFTFLAVNDAMNASVAQTFASGFEAAGMKVTVTQMPQINLLANVATGNYELSQFRLYGQPNPDADVTFYWSKTIVPGISVNFPRFASPEIDQAIVDALGSADPAKRAQDYEKVSKTMASAVPVVWLGQLTWMVAANPRVNGIYGAMNGSIPTVGPKMWIQSLSVSS